MGLEPTTPCLQTAIERFCEQGVFAEVLVSRAGQYRSVPSSHPQLPSVVARKWHDGHPIGRASAASRASPRVPSPSTTTETHMHPNPDDRDALFTRAPESAPKLSYRLAGAATGTGRSTRSTRDGTLDPAVMLDDAAALLEPEPGVDRTRTESVDEFTRRYVARYEHAMALADAAYEYDEALRRGAIERRRLTRKADAIRNRRRRESERDSATERRRPNHPVKIDVDAAAWATVKGAAYWERLAMGDKVAQLVDRAVQDRVVPRRSPARTPERRFARLFVDEETWAAFRALALDADVSAGRLVGLLVEREAKRHEGGGQ